MPPLTRTDIPSDTAPAIDNGNEDKQILTQENVAASPVARKFGGVQAAHPAELHPGMALSIVGPGGSRKTSLASTVVDSELGRPALLVDMNSNPQVITDERSKHIYVAPIDEWWQLESIVKDFELGKNNDIRTIILDHFSAMYNANLDTQTQKDKRASYNLTQADSLRLTRRLLNLAEKGQRLNVIYIYQEVTEERVVYDENNIPRAVQRREVNLSNKMQGYMPSMMPFMCFLNIFPEFQGPGVGMADFRSSPHTQAKWQSKQTERLRKIPPVIWNPNLGTLVDCLQGDAEFPVAAHTKPRTVLPPREDKQD